VTGIIWIYLWKPEASDMIYHELEARGSVCD